MFRRPILIVSLLLLLLPLRAQLLINEFQVSNITTGLDPGVNYRQWIEIYNTGDQSIDLYGYFLSDEPGNPQKFKISEHITLSSERREILWLDPDNDYYGLLKLDMDGGELTLAEPSGEVSDHISYPPQYMDIAYGRETDAAATWVFFDHPTPDESNSTVGYPIDAFPDSLNFSLPGGFYAGSQLLVLSSNSPGEIRYTKNGSWPTESSYLYQSSIELSSSIVIRARVFEEGRLPGEVLTNTYFVDEESSIPIISISTDSDNFFSGNKGLYVEGYVGIPGLCMDIPVNWNRDWERPINFEYFTRDGSQVINQMAGTKIFGGCSRSNTFKSLALYARKSYGDNSFNHQFFSSKNISEFKGLVLRNSGNDSYFSMLRDGFMQSLVMGKMDIDYLGYQPANVFINGEYFGILNVREKINEHYIASNYNIDPDQVDLLEKEAYFEWGEVISGSGEYYGDLFDYLDGHDMSDDSNFEHVSTLMDVEEFLNYYLVQIYFQNEDWPQNNIKYWRYHGEGGKWRWILFDTDFGWGLFTKSGNSLQWATRGATDDLLIRSLLENENFKNEFIQRMAGFINTIFHPDTVTPILDSIIDLVADEIPRHTQRWGRPSLEEFEYHTGNKMPKFTATRPDSIRIFMQYKFGIPGLETLSSSVDDPLKGYVEAAGMRLPDQFSGLYFENVPLRMHAVPRPGYKFSHWEGASTSTSNTMHLVLQSDLAVKAVFTIAGPVENVFLNEVGASNDYVVTDEFGQFNDWVEIYNDNDFKVDLAGCFLSDSAGFLEMYQFPFGSPDLTTVGAKDYLIIWCDGQAKQGALHTNFKLSKAGESLFLAQKQGEALSIIDSVFYADQFTDVSFGRNPDVDRWDYMIPSPGEMNWLMGPLTLHINEYISRNDGSHRDEYNEADDWIELYNPTDDTINIAGLFLTDSLEDPLKHQIPFGDISTIIPPKGYIVLWADGQEAQGVLHLGFKLNSRTEQIGLYQVGAGLIDSLSYLVDHPDIPTGRFPDGSSNLQYLGATPGFANQAVVPIEGLWINEFMARNPGPAMDEFGELDDWIEIYNDNDYPVDLGGLFLCDSLDDPIKYRIPTGATDTTTIPAHGFIVLWADGQEEQGVLHLGFKLNSRTEQIGLYQVGAGLIDSLSYLVDHPDIPTGRFPDGSINLQYLGATPGSANQVVIPLGGLWINEFMARNPGPAMDEFGELDDWIEIYNDNDYPVDLGGLFLSDSLDDPIKYRIPTGATDTTTIPAHGYIVLWADGQEEQGVLHLGFKLNSRTEQIGLYQVGAGLIDSLSYLVDHPDIPTGRFPDGSSNLQYLGATPGSANRVVVPVEGLWINEFMARNPGPAMDEFGELDDWIEIYNDNDYPVDLGGLFLSDSLDDPIKYRIPTGATDTTTIPAHGYIVLWADGQVGQGVLHLGFKLNSRTEQIGLYQVGAGLIDSLSYKLEHPEVPSGRYPDGSSGIQYLSATPGLANDVLYLEGLWINEFMARNVSSAMDEYGEFDDWIEIYNDNDYPVDLGGLFLTDSLGYPTKHRIPMGVSDSTTIAAHGFLVLWADNQKEQGVLHLDFSLSGKGEQIGLSQPDGKQFIDTLSYGPIYANQAYGLLGTEAFIQIVSSSPGMPNFLNPSEKLYISEIVASGNESYPDQHGEFDDWIEIYNDNDFKVDIGGFYLTDSMDHPQKFRIPGYAPDSTTIEPKGYLVLWADNQPNQGINHLNFRLRGDGEYLALSGTNGVDLLDSVSFPNQFKHFSFSREDNLGEWKHFPSTPGARNIALILSGLLINEFMTSNTSIPDENGDFVDWIEIYNANTYSVDVGGLYLTDSLGAPTKYRIPSHSPLITTINPQGYLVFYADNLKDKGLCHVNFKLRKEGEQIALIHYDERTVIDSLSYEKQFTNASFSRMNEEGGWCSIPPSPGAENICPDLSKLVINEVMGYNRTVVGDEYREYDNWMELYNKGDTPIDIGGLYFTDRMESQNKFRMSSEYPDSTTIDPYDYLVLWADDSASQGILHLGFNISKTGENLGIFDYTGKLVDSMYYPFISPNLSWGRMPDGYDLWTRFDQPTPSKSNLATRIHFREQDQMKLKIYPNPVSESATFEFILDQPGEIRIEIVNSHGSLISIIQAYGAGVGPEKIRWDVRDAGGGHLPPGIYLFRATGLEFNISGTFEVL